MFAKMEEEHIMKMIWTLRANIAHASIFQPMFPLL